MEVGIPIFGTKEIREAALRFASECEACGGVVVVDGVEQNFEVVEAVFDSLRVAEAFQESLIQALKMLRLENINADELFRDGVNPYVTLWEV